MIILLRKEEGKKKEVRRDKNGEEMEVRKFDKNYDTKEVSKEEETKRGEKERRGGLQIRII